MAVQPTNTNPTNQDLRPIQSDASFYIKVYGKGGTMPYSPPKEGLGFIKGSGSSDLVLGMGGNMPRFSMPSNDLIRTTGGIVLPKKSRKIPKPKPEKSYIKQSKKRKSTSSKPKSISKKKKSSFKIKINKNPSSSYPIIH